MSHVSERGAPTPELPYHPAAVESVLGLIRAVAPQAARLVAAILRVRETSKMEVLDAQRVADFAWPGLDPACVLEAIREANREALANLDIDLVVFGRRQRDGATPSTDVALPADVAATDRSLRANLGPTIVLSDTLVEVLDEAPSNYRLSEQGAEFDCESREWLALVAAMAHSGQGGHLASRTINPSMPRLSDDCAISLAGQVPLLRLSGTGALAAAILRIELHSGISAPVVFVEDRNLAMEHAAQDEEDWLDAAAPAAPVLAPAPFKRAARWLPHVRGTYLWPIAETGSLAIGALPFVGAIIGPMRYDPRWIRTVLSNELSSETGSPAVELLAARIVDPRDAKAVARVARVAAQALPFDLANACAMVAASFSGTRSDVSVLPDGFDPSLLVCEPEAHALLARASVLAANGCRVLGWGPPGGGKSTFARALAVKMAAGRVVRIVTPADILARQWGAMERLVRALWRRAADHGEVLVIDEFEAICGARGGDATSGNALLVRSLTDEVLRNLDGFPLVPLIATVNDPAAVDAAARRRFSFVLRFGDAMDPNQERRAWQTMLGCHPPPAWSACGAVVADISLARSQCKMIDRMDPQSLASAILRAREARLGILTARSTRRPRETRH